MFKNHDLIHNHDIKSGKPVYRYPLIQFKLIGKTPVIIALTSQAVTIFSELFMKLNEIRIDEVSIPVFEKDLTIEEVEYGFVEGWFEYEFYSPWIGLNQKNYQLYERAAQPGKIEILQKILVGNILSLSKGLGYWLGKNQIIKAELHLHEMPVRLKCKTMKGFKGRFKTNFIIPDHLGFGKAVSRGFGTVRRVI